MGSGGRYCRNDVVCITQLLLNRPLGGRPMSNVMAVIFWLLFGIGLPALFLFGKLITEVREDGVYVQYIPFHRGFHRIPFTDIIKCEARTYRPIREYGGWGIRFGSRGRAYNVSGNRGVQLVFESGKRLLIGSNRPEEFSRAIQTGIGRKK